MRANGKVNMDMGMGQQADAACDAFLRSPQEQTLTALVVSAFKAFNRCSKSICSTSDSSSLAKHASKDCVRYIISHSLCTKKHSLLACFCGRRAEHT
jgi:hypothetical protein